MWKGWKECVENTEEEARGEWRRKEAREDRERECQMRNGRERENQRERESERKRGGEEGCFLSLSLPPSPARTREGRREAKEEEEYGKGGFAGKTLHGEGG